MDLIFLPQNQKGRPFIIEVGFFDTVLEIKQKVKKYQGIPVSSQTLVFNGRILADDGDIASCVLLHNSRINLFIVAKKTVCVRVKILTPTMHVVPFEMHLNDTVLNLKNEILVTHKTTPSAENRSVLVLHFKGEELQENGTLRECGVSDCSEIELSFRLTVVVQSMYCETAWGWRVPVTVHPLDEVSVLRTVLGRLNREGKLGIPLPLEYFFVHEQVVMDDDLSFWWHHVGHCDTIWVFPGSFALGS
ncbi:hypothetical protein TIFTF001_018978 [Ficus carica]|uniref:Ubiquitin-like domain-containing protein n=1 Tax=Ficus carica TaxID=3494 RepID=A0AA88ASG3_FICCA|nr:hypothetical protein TIFTF001_018978 [Ficus carica]